MWCNGHSQPPGASAVLAVPGTASAGLSCRRRSLEGGASPALLARGTVGEGRPKGVGSWGLMLSGQSCNSPALLQLVVYRPANAREDGVRGWRLLPHPQSQGLKIHYSCLPQCSPMWGPCATGVPRQRKRKLGPKLKGLPRWLWGPNEATYQQSGRASRAEMTAELDQKQAIQSG